MHWSLEIPSRPMTSGIREMRSCLTRTLIVSSMSRALRSTWMQESPAMQSGTMSTTMSRVGARQLKTRIPTSTVRSTEVATAAGCVGGLDLPEDSRLQPAGCPLATSVRTAHGFSLSIRGRTDKRSMWSRPLYPPLYTINMSALRRAAAENILGRCMPL
jgi:hypothetical protein